MRGKLLYDGKPVYQFTDADWDLAVRAVEGEAGKNACSDSEGLAVMVCMINRWAMMLTLRWYQKLLLKQPEAKVYGFESFADMSDSYSQPVNPAWLDGGSKDKHPGQVSAAEKRRAEFLSRPIEEFPESIRFLVARCLDGQALAQGVRRDMTGLVHFFLPALYYARKLGRERGIPDLKVRDLTDDEVLEASRIHYGNKDKGLVYSQPAGVNPRSNAFYKIPRTRRWGSDTIKVVP